MEQVYADTSVSTHQQFNLSACQSPSWGTQGLLLFFVEGEGGAVPQGFLSLPSFAHLCLNLMNNHMKKVES